MAVTLNGSALPPPPPKVKKTRRTDGSNSRGYEYRHPIHLWLKDNPNKMLSEIKARFPALNVKTLAYHMARGVELHIFTCQGNSHASRNAAPRYSVVHHGLSDEQFAEAEALASELVKSMNL